MLICYHQKLNQLNIVLKVKLINSVTIIQYQKI